MHVNYAIKDLIENPWPESSGGLEAQARVWLGDIEEMESYPGELAEFYAYLDEQGIEIQGSGE